MASEPENIAVVVSREDDEARNRSSYLLKLILLALLPYVYVLTVAAVIFTLFALLAWTIISDAGRDNATVRIEIALAILAALFLRSILVRIPPPKGVTTPKETSAALLTTAHEIARTIRGPKIDSILWNEEFDLEIIPVPRFSLLGWPRRYYLRIGLPLMLALSPEQFRARLAHELGHFASAHGRLRSWFYHYRFTWAALLSVLSSRGRWGSWLFSRFFHLHVLFFLRYALPAFRYHEYEADRCAAAATSAEVTAEALIRLDYGSYLANELWEDDFDKAEQAENDSYTFIADLLQWPLTDEQTKEWLEYTLQDETYSSQLHPALKDRLAALGQSVRPPAPIAQSAADVYLADHLPHITDRLKHDRDERMGTTWQAQDPHLDSANPLLKIYARGTRLLDEDCEEGVALVKRAMELDPTMTSVACGQLTTYYSRQGDIISSHHYTRRSATHWEFVEKAIAERTQVSFIETFLPHDLSEREIDLIRTELTRHREIKAAYLVRKDVAYLPDKPSHALGVVFDRRWFRKTNEDLSFAKRLPPARKHPPELHAFVLNYKNRRLGNNIRKVANSLVYQKSE